MFQCSQGEFTVPCWWVHCVLSHSAASDSLWPRGLQPTRPLCPWDFSGKSNGMGCLFIQEIFPTQELSPYLLCFLHYRQILYLLSHAFEFSSVQSLSRVQLFAGLQHTRSPCPSPTPRVYSNSCLLNRWCYPTISSSVIPSPTVNLSQHQGLLQWVSSLHQVAKVLEFQLQHQSFKWIFRTDFL